MAPLDPSTHGVFSWNELMTTDMDQAQRFYGELFGWTFEHGTISHGPMAGQPYATAKHGYDQLAGIMPMAPNAKNIPPNWGAYVTVSHMVEALERVAALGGRVLIPETPIEGLGSFALVQDPQGAVFSLFTLECQE
ncbi:MAG: VOC family protein [Desulfovibrio sp.]|nr:MAG: VOC family protein [Desulfovibrio sp.]